MRTWSKAVIAAAKGAIGGTFDSVGTIQLKNRQDLVLFGFIALVIPSLPTAGQNGVPIVRINSEDLGISNQDFIIANAETDAIATNGKEVPVFAEFVPFKTKEGAKLANAQIEIFLTNNVSMTGGSEVCVSAVYGDEEPDDAYMRELMSGMVARMIGGKTAQQDAGISAAALTSFTNGISVKSNAAELIGLSGFVNTNAPTAGENCVGFTEFQASQIDDFSPQEWPFNFGMTASLGTPVGTAVPANSKTGVYHPTRFPLPLVNFTMNVSQKLAVALSNAGDGMAGAKWR